MKRAILAAGLSWCGVAAAQAVTFSATTLGGMTVSTFGAVNSLPPNTNVTTGVSLRAVSNFTLAAGAVDFVPQATASALLFSLSGSGSSAKLPILGCTLYTNALVALPLLASGSGSATLRLAAPAVTGLVLVAQGATLNGSLLHMSEGFDVSN